MPIAFRSEKITFSLKEKSRITDWIASVIRKEKRSLGEIHYIFCSDTFLLKLNKEYLKHNTLTDIITFDYSEKKETKRRDLHQHAACERECGKI